jgi:hypothetical protein
MEKKKHIGWEPSVKQSKENCKQIVVTGWELIILIDNHNLTQLVNYLCLSFLGVVLMCAKKNRHLLASARKGYLHLDHYHP